MLRNASYEYPIINNEHLRCIKNDNALVKEKMRIVGRATKIAEIKRVGEELA